MAPKETTIGNYYDDKKRTIKTEPGTIVQHLSGMQRTRSAGKGNSEPIQPQPLGISGNPQKGTPRGHGSDCQQGQAGSTGTGSTRISIPTDRKRTQGDQRRARRRRTRAFLAKKKSELGLKGRLTGHFNAEVRNAVVKTIQDTIDQGISQHEACTTFGIAPRKYRRWAHPKPVRARTAWNKVLPHECQAIEAAAYLPELEGKPVSHIFVHGHNTGAFFASMATVYRVLKRADLIEPVVRAKKRSPYVDAHTLLEQGFSLLCYDASQFTTESGVIVWAIPVIILPQRYVLHIGYSLNSVSSEDLTNTIKEALAHLPQLFFNNLVAHSDRGSAMKALATQRLIKELLGAPIHFGRPHTPDDEGWIEAFIKTLKYHRDTPVSFKIVDDILNWLARFPAIYNNDPHSSLKYVTPLQALSGQMEVILSQRKQNLAAAKVIRYNAWKAEHHLALPASKKEVASPF